MNEFIFFKMKYQTCLSKILINKRVEKLKRENLFAKFE